MRNDTDWYMIEVKSLCDVPIVQDCSCLYNEKFTPKCALDT